MPNRAMPVRVPLLKLTDAVSGKGSGLMVTDSTAIARVEVESLKTTGALWAPFAPPKAPPSRINRLTAENLLRLGVFLFMIEALAVVKGNKAHRIVAVVCRGCR